MGWGREGVKRRIKGGVRGNERVKLVGGGGEGKGKLSNSQWLVFSVAQLLSQFAKNIAFSPQTLL